MLIIQVIISIVVVYLIFSVIVYVVVEWIATALQLRGRNLQQAIFNLFEDAQKTDFGKLIYKHPQVNTLTRNDKKLPSYIPANNVSAALIDLVGAKTETVQKSETAFASYLTGLRQLNEGQLKTLLATITQTAQDLPTFTAAFEKWYNDYMDRVTGWYKKKIRWVVLAVSLAVNLSFNVDTIFILQKARTDPATRERLNALGDKLLADTAFHQMVKNIPNPGDGYTDEYVNDSSVHAGDTAVLNTSNPLMADNSQEKWATQYAQLAAIVKDSDLPVGWGIDKGYSKKEEWLFNILGWLLTTLALSAGAPFWFDVLKKLVNIRNAGPKPSGDGK